MIYVMVVPADEELRDDADPDSTSEAKGHGESSLFLDIDNMLSSSIHETLHWYSIVLVCLIVYHICE